MILLRNALNAFGTSAFNGVLKAEIAQLDASQLPLQQGLTTGSYALNGIRDVMIISVRADANAICVKAGIFYGGIIAGCSCADDPTPVEEQSEYCEVLLNIDRATANTQAILASD